MWFAQGAKSIFEFQSARWAVAGEAVYMLDMA